MNKIRLGIIGAGIITHSHLEVISSLENVNIVSISNRDYKKARIIATQYKIPLIYTNYKEMISNEKLDAVGIFTSPESITQISIDCINAGVHCLIEKPPGLKLEEAERIKEESHKKGVHVMVGLNRRFISTIIYSNKLIKESRLKSIIIEAPEKFNEVLESKKFSEETLKSWIYANGIHCIDLLIMFGGDFKEINSITKNNESYHALITFTNGISGHYYSEWNCPGNWGVTLVTDDYKIIISPLEKGIVINKKGEKEEFGLTEIDQIYKPGFYLQDKSFFDSIEKKKKISFPACSIDEAVKTMRLIKAIESMTITSHENSR